MFSILIYGPIWWGARSTIIGEGGTKHMKVKKFPRLGIFFPYALGQNISKSHHQSAKIRILSLSNSLFKKIGSLNLVGW